MRRFNTFKIMAILLLALPCFFQACIKDSCKSQHTYSYFVPVYKTKDEVRANIKSNAPQPIQNPGKIYVLGHTIFLNEIDKGIHIIDNSDPSHPRNAAFIDIPGNVDIAAKGTTMYADFYTDLVTMDISDPSHIVVKKIMDNMFPARYYGAGFYGTNDQIIIDWVRKDTTVTESCDQAGGWSPIRTDILFLSGSSPLANGAQANTPVGVGGSMARFTIMNNRLYAVTNSELNILSLANPVNPVAVNRINAGWGIETIYPFKDKLFMGSSAGMYIYDVSNPDVPTAAGQFQHVRSCDPVVADDDYAYVTLSSGTVCQGFNNELDIINLSNFSNPTLQKAYPLNNPHGLSKDGNLLFICDGSAGVRIFNTADVMNLQPVKTIGGMDATDVIAYNKWALVVAKDGLYQYDYASSSDIRLLSKMGISK